MIPGEKIRQRREALDITKQELAEVLGTTADAPSDRARAGSVPWQLSARIFSEEYMYSRLEASAEAEGLAETCRALPYMRDCHMGQTRKPVLGTGQRVPYIIHPLTAACQAHAMGIREDTVLAAALLHDVCEDCGVKSEELPFSVPVKSAVSLLTKDAGRFQEVGREAALAEYYRGMQGNQTAMLVKCLDRCNNLSTMAAGFSVEKMAQYIVETEKYILPMFEEIKRCRPDWDGAAFLLKYQMMSLLETQKALLNLQTLQA